MKPGSLLNTDCVHEISKTTNYFAGLPDLQLLHNSRPSLRVCISDLWQKCTVYKQASKQASKKTNNCPPSCACFGVFFPLQLTGWSAVYPEIVFFSIKNFDFSSLTRKPCCPFPWPAFLSVFLLLTSKNSTWNILPHHFFFFLSESFTFLSYWSQHRPSRNWRVYELSQSSETSKFWFSLIFLPSVPKNSTASTKTKPITYSIPSQSQYTASG